MKKTSSFYTAGKFAELIGVSKNTILRWNRENKFNPKKRIGLNRYYSDDQIKDALKFKETNKIKIGVKRGNK